jgi:hypothetical protein
VWAFCVLYIYLATTTFSWRLTEDSTNFPEDYRFHYYYYLRMSETIISLNLEAFQGNYLP